MILRDYQQTLVDLALCEPTYERRLLVLPTGGGKTHVAADIMCRTVGNGFRGHFIAHRQELIDQAANRFRSFGLRVGIVMADRPRDPDAPVQVSSIQTLVRRPHVPADVVIVDEAHRIRGKSYQTVLAKYPEETRVYGLTATPFRTDGKGLGEVFDAIVAPVTVRDLCNRGVILEPVVYMPPGGPDLSGVHRRRGDYEESELEAACNRPALVGDIVAHWRKIASGSFDLFGEQPARTAVFAVGIEHSKAITARFLEAGISAEHVDGTTRNRDEVWARLRSGQTLVVVNCGIITEGFDLPELEVAVIARPTQSLGLHIQMIGRVMRPVGRCIVIDHAGNHARHGFVTDEMKYTLDDGVVIERRPSLRTCVECFAIWQGASRKCPVCGTELPPPKPRKPPREVSGELVAARGADTSTPESRDATYRALVRKAGTRGYKIQWARVVYKSIFGRWPHDFPEMDRIYRAGAAARDGIQTTLDEHADA